MSSEPSTKKNNVCSSRSQDWRNDSQGIEHIATNNSIDLSQRPKSQPRNQRKSPTNQKRQTTNLGREQSVSMPVRAKTNLGREQSVSMPVPNDVMIIFAKDDDDSRLNTQFAKQFIDRSKKKFGTSKNTQFLDALEKVIY